MSSVQQEFNQYLKSDENPWSVNDFERERPHLVNFVKQQIFPLIDDKENNRITIRAPVKSGKREIVEYIAIRDMKSKNSNRIHVFISAWHRRADEIQRKELGAHNLYVFSIISDKNVEECVKFIHKELNDDKRIIIHLDECDYGSGEKQKLCNIYKELNKEDDVTFILYSATPEEVFFSGICSDDSQEYIDILDEIREGCNVFYDPPKGFCGPKKFLDENLIYEAQPFFTKKNKNYELTNQGKEILKDFDESFRKNPYRNIIVLRLSYSLSDDKKGKEKKAIYEFLSNICSFDELDDFTIIADKGDKFNNIKNINRVILDDIKWSEQWQNPKTGKIESAYWKRIVGKTIIVIDQTSCRSTEWVCHNKIFAYHDFRHIIHFVSSSQACERVNHYEQKYGGFQPIRVYANKKTFMLSAGVIGYEKYIMKDWIKRKINKKKGEDDNKEEKKYQIKNSSSSDIHPQYNMTYTKEEANQILMDLECYTKIKISSRVQGKAKETQEVDIKFIKCNIDNFREKIIKRNKKNPFEECISLNPNKDEKSWYGFLRVWKIFDYKEIVNNKHWGIGPKTRTIRYTICYNDGELGVAVRTPNGNIITISNFNTYKSMYCNK